MYIYGSVENVLGITLKTLGTWYDCGHEMPRVRDTAPASLYFIVFYHDLIIQGGSIFDRGIYYNRIIIMIAWYNAYIMHTLHCKNKVAISVAG